MGLVVLYLACACSAHGSSSPRAPTVSRTRYSWQSIVPPKSVASWHVHSEGSELPITSHTPSPRARTAASAAGVAVEATLPVTLPANELSGFRQTEPARVVLQVVPAGQEKRPPRQTDA